MSVPSTSAARLILTEVSAAELMTGNPVSLRTSATVPEATALLTDRGFSAAPVIDESGHPVGVVSKADILIHAREQAVTNQAHAGTAAAQDTMRVEEIMTPAVFSVTADAPAALVVQEMVKLNVHQLFVVDERGTLIGTVAALDLLRHLHAE